MTSYLVILAGLSSVSCFSIYSPYGCGLQQFSESGVLSQLFSQTSCTSGLCLPSHNGFRDLQSMLESFNPPQCRDVVVRPQEVQQEINVPVIQDVVQTLAAPVVEEINYQATPINCQSELTSGTDCSGVPAIASANCGCSQGCACGFE